MGIYSPIKSVAPVNASGTVGTAVTNLADTATYIYRLADISASKAGRTEDTVMHKMRIAQAVRLDVGWNFISTAEGSKIMSAFNPQYVQIIYLDLKAGAWATKIFYVTDRAAPLYNSTSGLWEGVDFGLIERAPVRITY